jgi:hypothetical protein
MTMEPTLRCSEYSDIGTKGGGDDAGFVDWDLCADLLHESGRAIEKQIAAAHEASAQANKVR